MKLVSSVALVVCLSLGGCSSFGSAISGPTTLKPISNTHEANAALKLAVSCCKRFSEIKYKDFSEIKDNDEVINASNNAYIFPEGKSYFSAYKLPLNRGDFRITLSSVFTKTVFVPKVILLDGEFNVTRIIDSSSFSFEPANLLNENQFTGVFTVDRSHSENIHNETYMIIYTPENSLATSTTIDSDEMRYARARSLAAPRNAKIDIPHSAWGNINLKVNYLSDLNSKNNIYIPLPIEKNTLPNKADISDAASDVSGAAHEMLKETEDYYNEQIKLAIKKNDIKKAVALYKEAKRLGSPTAEAVLIKGLE